VWDGKRFSRRLALAAKWGLTIQIFWWAVVTWADALAR